MRWALFVSVLLLLVLRAASPAAGQSIIYVDGDSDNMGDGSSWENAFVYLQDALAVAEAGDEIWVAEGIYYPDLGANVTEGNREESFHLKSGVEIYGGFKGTEAERSQRNWTEHETILSGDLEQDDTDSLGQEVPSRLDNSASVVVAGHKVDSTAVIDGFTITGGHSEGDLGEAHQTGGGMEIRGTLVIRNIVFEANVANFGGGLYVTSGATLENLTFRGNYSGYQGGGMYVEFDEMMIIRDLTFISNISEGCGGGAMVRDGPMVLLDAIFINNRAECAGGLYLRRGEQVIINASFFGNVATQGGGLATSETISTTVINAVFSGNTALSGPGGGTGWGGAISHFAADLTAINVVLFGNTAAEAGGGLFNGGGAIFYNSIFWGNVAPEGDQVYSPPNDSLLISHSIIEEGLPPNADDGDGNLATDPLFADPGGADDILGTLDDNFHLLSSSPAIDTGLNGILPDDSLDLNEDGDRSEPLPIDLDYHVRIFDGGGDREAIVDMGAFEFNAPPIETGVETPDAGNVDLPLLKVYPNPAHSDVTVTFALPVTEPVTLILYDILGRRIQVLYNGIAIQGIKQPISFDADDLAGGVYIMRLSSKEITTIEFLTIMP